jgi:hypothetical protein
MGPTLLLDKSSFQALKSCEMHKLTNYFQWNIVDILLEEIRCDLLNKAPTASFPTEASMLADKYSPIDSVQNMNSRELCLENLFGHEVVMDGRPFVAPTSINTQEDGKRIAFIDLTRFGEMIRRWQKGEFNKQDKDFANLWKGIKDNAKADNCVQFLQANHIIIPESKSIDELRIVVDELLRNPKMQYVFLDMFLSYQEVDQIIKYNIKERLKQCPYSLEAIS